MKTVVLGDIHGRTIWKDILKAEETYDRVIFIGDYLDTFDDISGAEQLKNLQDIIEFKGKQQFAETILLIGNHDYQYWPNGLTNENYSGFQPGMYWSFLDVFEKNKKLFQMCYQDEEGVIYSHAGFTETFVEQKIGTFSVDQVNNVFNYKPQAFKFYPLDRSHCGDDIHQSCIWVRPGSLDKDAIYKTQVVGHTQQDKINLLKSKRRNYYLIDALAHKQYLIKENGIFNVHQL